MLLMRSCDTERSLASEPFSRYWLPERACPELQGPEHGLGEESKGLRMRDTLPLCSDLLLPQTVKKFCACIFVELAKRPQVLTRKSVPPLTTVQ